MAQEERAGGQVMCSAMPRASQIDFMHGVVGYDCCAGQLQDLRRKRYGVSNRAHGLVSWLCASTVVVDVILHRFLRLHSPALAFRP